jgi:hypothetical protein
MEPSVVVVLVGAALAALIAASRRAVAPEPIPVRVDDDPQPTVSPSLSRRFFFFLLRPLTPPLSTAHQVNLRPRRYL